MRKASLAAALMLAAIVPVRAEVPGVMIGQACLGCHGPAGAGGNGVPAIAGRPAALMVGLMQEFRGGQRPGTIMGRIVRGYTEAEVAAAAEWLAAQR